MTAMECGVASTFFILCHLLGKILNFGDQVFDTCGAIAKP
jgi:hypothetical protein